MWHVVVVGDAALGESTAAGADAQEEEGQEANDDQASDGSADDPAHHRRVGLLPVERSEAWRQNMELQCYSLRDRAGRGHGRERSRRRGEDSCARRRLEGCECSSAVRERRNGGAEGCNVRDGGHHLRRCSSAASLTNTSARASRRSKADNRDLDIAGTELRTGVAATSRGKGNWNSGNQASSREY